MFNFLRLGYSQWITLILASSMCTLAGAGEEVVLRGSISGTPLNDDLSPRTPRDLGGVKILTYRQNRVVNSTYSEADGSFSLTFDSDLQQTDNLVFDHVEWHPWCTDAISLRAGNVTLNPILFDLKGPKTFELNMQQLLAYETIFRLEVGAADSDPAAAVDVIKRLQDAYHLRLLAMPHPYDRAKIPGMTEAQRRQLFRKRIEVFRLFGLLNTDRPNHTAFLLGIRLAEVYTPDIEPETGQAIVGIGVVETFDGSPAQQLGLEPGDVILRINGRRVADISSYIDTINVSSGSAWLRLRNVRNGQFINSGSIALTPNP